MPSHLPAYYDPAHPSPPYAMPAKCAWCGRWRSQEDETRAKSQQEQISHSICPECYTRNLNDPPPF